MNKALSIISAALLLSGCVTTDQYGNPIASPMAPVGGALGGAAVSGLACSNLGKGNGTVAIVGVCTALGALGGLMAGSAYSQSRQATAGYQVQQQQFQYPQNYQRSYQQQLPSRYNGQSGSVEMSQQYYNPQYGANCREWQHRGTVGGRTQQLFGTACQQQDGSWRIVG
jgi:surface antigen